MCVSPLKGYLIGKTDRGKPKYLITSYKCHHVEHTKQDKFVPCYTERVSPNAISTIREYREMPCGKCVECRLAYSRQWADRCMLELEDHDESYFLTLTYDDAHLPVVESIDDDGVYHLHSTLVKRDVQLFLKRLRKDGQKIRYFMCGEYGSESRRAHYHMIIYGLHLDDLILYSRNTQGDPLYNSEYLNRMWHYQGYVVVGKVTWQSCAYVARYIMKKQYGYAAGMYKDLGITPEYTAMSRRPGIGRNYYDKHKSDIYESEYIHISTESGGRRIRPPRYFDDLYAAENPGTAVYSDLRYSVDQKHSRCLNLSN